MRTETSTANRNKHSKPRQTNTANRENRANRNKHSKWKMNKRGETLKESDKKRHTATAQKKGRFHLLTRADTLHGKKGAQLKPRRFAGSTSTHRHNTDTDT